MTTTRREFLQGSGALAAGLAAGCSGAQRSDAPAMRAADPAAAVFTHALASGDPLPDRVILWTRALPPAGQDSLALRYLVARDEQMQDIVAEGVALATAETDYTVKVDPLLPSADTVYWYRFEAPELNLLSPLGRTRTAPLQAEKLRFVATTCTNPAAAALPTLSHIAALDDLHFVLHLGDYIYEFGSSAYAPDHACVSLADYRMRYASWRAPQPQIEAHRLHPWVVIYDDGELANGNWTEGAEAHDPATQGDWRERRAAAVRAFEEWVPIRVEARYADGRARVYRKLPLGNLADLLLVDIRLDGRDAFLSDHYVTFNVPEYDDPDRHIMSTAQMDWLTMELGQSTAVWKLMGNQAMLGHWGGPGAPRDVPPQIRQALALREGGNELYVNGWSGFPAERRRLYAALETAGVDNLLVCSGDTHFSFAMDLPPDPFNPAAYDPVTGRGSLGIEFVTPSVNSEAFPEEFGYAPRTASLPVEAASLLGNPHHKYTELDSKGYCLITLTAQQARCEYWFVDDVYDESSGQTLAAVFESAAGSRRVELRMIDPTAGSGL